MNVDIIVPINCEQDIVAARHQGRALALALRFSPAQATLIATAISELARSMVASAESGEIALTVVPESGREGIQVVARHRGTLPRDPAGALHSALSRSGALGLGLSGVKRVADEFDIVSEEPRGMTAVFTRWNAMERPSGDPVNGRAREDKPELERSYSKMLEEYLEGGGENALRDAYELGRAAHKRGVGLLGIAALHHAALAGFLQRDDLAQAGEFFGETLSAYEMARLSHQDAVSALRRMNQTLEQQIKRIAHAVHDEAGQLLVAAHLSLSTAERNLAPEARQRLQDVHSILQRLDDELRRLSHNLRPRVLDDLGLVPALEDLAAGLRKRSGLDVRVESSVRERFDAHVETTLYRVVQESLTNAVKHSGATGVAIHLSRDGKDLCCAIRDDGRGFDLSAALADADRRGLGLLGMRERVNAVGGELQIDSLPNAGTQIRARIPVER